MNVLENPINAVKVHLNEVAFGAEARSRPDAINQALATMSVECANIELDDLCLHFQTSLNEEHTFLNVSQGNKGKINLGERAHHYCLLTLARRRLNDAKNGLDPSSQGWIELAQLSKSLGLEPEHLNIQIFRARTQLVNAFPHLAQLPSIIERRRGELRFGAHHFCSVRGSQIEGEYFPVDEHALA